VDGPTLRGSVRWSDSFLHIDDEGISIKAERRGPNVPQDTVANTRQRQLRCFLPLSIVSPFAVHGIPFIVIGCYSYYICIYHIDLAS
jgi:hypothetical protein